MQVYVRLTYRKAQCSKCLYFLRTYSVRKKGSLDCPHSSSDMIIIIAKGIENIVDIFTTVKNLKKL